MLTTPCMVGRFLNKMNTTTKNLSQRTYLLVMPLSKKRKKCFFFSETQPSGLFFVFFFSPICTFALSNLIIALCQFSVFVEYQHSVKKKPHPHSTKKGSFGNLNTELLCLPFLGGIKVDFFVLFTTDTTRELSFPFVSPQPKCLFLPVPPASADER